MDQIVLAYDAYINALYEMEQFFRMVKKALGPIIEEAKNAPEGVTIEFNEAYLEQKLAEKCGRPIKCADIGITDMKATVDGSFKKSFLGLFGQMKLNYNELQKNILALMQAKHDARLEELKNQFESTYPDTSIIAKKFALTLITFDDDVLYNDFEQEVKRCQNIKEVEALCGNLSSTYLIEALTKRVTELEKQVEKNRSDISWLRARTNYIQFSK